MTTETVSPYPETVPSSSNPAARASLVVAIVIIVLELARQTVSQFIPLIMRGAGFDTGTVGVLFGVIAAGLGVLAIVGLILGIVGLGGGRGSAGRASAGAGTAIAASTIVGVALGFVAPLLLNALY